LNCVKPKPSKPSQKPAEVDPKLTVSAEQQATIERMHADGATKAAMARATGLTRPTVYAVLRGGW
jgi:hypothetical protein